MHSETESPVPETTYMTQTQQYIIELQIRMKWKEKKEEENAPEGIAIWEFRIFLFALVASGHWWTSMLFS